MAYILSIFEGLKNLDSLQYRGGATNFFFKIIEFDYVFIRSICVDV
jgi:hypothetical protein